MAKRSRIRDVVCTVVPLILVTQACHQAIDPTEPSDPSEPGNFGPQSPPSAPADVWFLEDFSTYGSVSGDPTTDFRNNINDRWLEPTSFQFAEIRSDPTFGQYWRQNLGLRTPENCQPGGGTGLRLKLPVEGVLPRPEPQEIWVETFVRLSPNYKTNWADDPRTADPDDCGSGAHKFLFFGRRFPSTSSTWRFEIATQGNFIKIKGAENKDANQYRGGYSFLPMGPSNPESLPNPCMTGVWLRFRYHLRAASAHGVSDGHVEWRWVEMDDPDVVVLNPCANNVKMWYLGETPFEAHGGWTELQLGKTFNAGPYDPVWFEYGEIRVWKDDPGWGW